MTEFPYQPTSLKAELLLGGTWTDVTPVYLRADDSDSPILIERGQPDEASTAKPSKCALTLDSTDGRFSPRNPAGAYYGNLVRNTPLRVSVEQGERRLVLADGGVQLFTADSAPISVTGDLDIRYEATLRSWTTGGLLGDKGFSGSEQSYELALNDDGTLTFWWSTTGSNSLSATSTAAVPLPHHGRKAVRATIDVNNGASGRTITFYYSSDGTLSGTWVQLGDAVIQAGTTSIFDGTATLGFFCPGGGQLHRTEIRNGIAGSAVANPDLSILAEGALTFVDAAGRTWNISGTAETAAITNRRQRFIGEVPDWPVSWEASSADAMVSIEASGVLRRLGQGSQGLGSALYRGVLRAATSLVAYWPMEDASGATGFASPLGNPPGKWSGSPSLAAFSDLPASAAIPTLNGARITLQPNTLPAVTKVQVRWVMNVPAAGAVDTVVLLQFTAGNLLWVVKYFTGGALSLEAYDASSTKIVDTGITAFDVDGVSQLCSVELTQSGANISYTLATLIVGEGSGAAMPGSVSTQTVGAVRTISINPTGQHADVAIGHVYVQDDVTSLFDLSSQLNAWIGETAGARISRLCSEEGVPFTFWGTLSRTVALGAQPTGTLLGLINEAIEADGGQLVEPRDSALPSLGYIPRSAQYRLPAAVAAVYGSLSGLTDLQPVDDDQGLVNDVKVTRDGGSSYRAVLDAGPLSVATAGRYDEAVTLNLATDDQLPTVAGWRLARGSYDDARWPVLGFDLLEAGVLSSALLASLVNLELGDRVTVASLPSFLPPGPAATLVTALQEKLAPWSWCITATGIPSGPFDVGRATSNGAPGTGQSGGKAQTSGSTTAASFVAGTGVSLSVATASGSLWTTTAGQMPIYIIASGVILKVTDISGASSPQAFTVDAVTTNGINKTIPSGSAVKVYDPARAAL